MEKDLNGTFSIQIKNLVHEQQTKLDNKLPYCLLSQLLSLLFLENAWIYLDNMWKDAK